MERGQQVRFVGNPDRLRIPVKPGTPGTYWGECHGWRAPHVWVQFAGTDDEQMVHPDELEATQ